MSLSVKRGAYKIIDDLRSKKTPLAQPIRVQPSREILNNKDIIKYLSSITEKEIKKWGKRKVFMDVKYKGVRSIILIDMPEKKIKLLSRTLKTKTYEKFLNKYKKEIVNGIKWSNVSGDVILDGEIFAYGKNKEILSQAEVTGFARNPKNKKIEPKIEVFDVLMVNDKDIRSLPLKERKKKLEKIVGERSIIEIAKSYYLSPRKIKGLFSRVLKRGHEGLVIKDPDSKYISGKSDKLHWIKLKKADNVDLELKYVSAWPRGKLFKFYKHWVLVPRDKETHEIKVDKAVRAAKMDYEWYTEFTKEILKNIDKFKTSGKVKVHPDYVSIYRKNYIPEKIIIPKGKRIIVEIFSEDWTNTLKPSGPKIIGIREDKKEADTMKDIGDVVYTKVRK